MCKVFRHQVFRPVCLEFCEPIKYSNIPFPVEKNRWLNWRTKKHFMGSWRKVENGPVLRERERCLRGVLIGSSTRILSIILQIEACRNGLNNNNSRASTSLSEISAIERNLLESQLNTVLVICSFLLIDYLFMLWSLMTHVYTVWDGRWRNSKSLLSASSKQNLVMSFKHLLC